ncbi:hypothetical protein, partial [Erwinia amylovora]|uniref:hypothetical protein n=1 Tax=Erwinia amylovora TaxID=552 RepID=UPI0020BFDC08
FEKLKLPFWIDRFIYKLKFFMKHFLHFIFYSKKNIKFYEAISFFYELITLLRYRSKLNVLYLNIFNLKNKLKQNTY